MAKSKRDMFLKTIQKDSSKHRGKTESLPLDKIIADDEIQSRVTIDNDVIEEYAEAMLSGSVFPEIIIFRDEKGHNYIADGFHRYKATQKAGLKTIDCEIKHGSKRDAIFYSVGANTTHGLRRTNADKRKAILTLLQDDEWSKYSARKIAEVAGVDDKTVGVIKKEIGLCTTDIIGSDGRSYNINPTAEIPQSKNKRTKYYRFKMDMEYKDQMKDLIKSSNLKEAALLKEAFEYLKKKYQG